MILKLYKFMTPAVIEAIEQLARFADNHAHDVYEPEENEQYTEHYDEVMHSVEVVDSYLQNLTK